MQRAKEALTPFDQAEALIGFYLHERAAEEVTEWQRQVAKALWMEERIGAFLVKIRG